MVKETSDKHQDSAGRGVTGTTNWSSRFAELDGLSDDDRALLERSAMRVQLGPGQRVFAPGTKPEAFLLVVEGTVRVQQVGINGREIVLYRISGGESCIMTTACLLSGEDYLAEGVTETQVSALALPKPAFDTLMARSKAFRSLIFARYASRMTRLMALVEDVAFERIDARLARKLLELSSDCTTLTLTHQELAVELGTAREVISRQLKSFVSLGLVDAGRGRIEIRDRAGIERIAGM